MTEREGIEDEWLACKEPFIAEIERSRLIESLGLDEVLRLDGASWSDDILGKDPLSGAVILGRKPLEIVLERNDEDHVVWVLRRAQEPRSGKFREHLSRVL